MEKLLLALILVFNSSCSTRLKRFNKNLAAGQCHQALENIPENSKGVKFVKTIKRTTNTILSYAVTGAGYTSDVVLSIAGGAVIIMALCAPILLAQAHSSTPAIDIHGYPCIPIDLDISPPTTGKKAYKATRDWRCPDLTGFSQSIRKIAQCYSDEGSKESLEKAKINLLSLTRSEHFNHCIDETEKARVLKAFYTIDRKLK